VFHALEVGFGMFEDQLRIDDCCVLKVSVDGALDVFWAVVEVDKDGIDNIVESRLGQLDVPAAEKYVDGCCYLEPNWILRIIEPF